MACTPCPTSFLMTHLNNAITLTNSNGFFYNNSQDIIGFTLGRWWLKRNKKWRKMAHYSLLIVSICIIFTSLSRINLEFIPSTIFVFIFIFLFCYLILLLFYLFALHTYADIHSFTHKYPHHFFFLNILVFHGEQLNEMYNLCFSMHVLFVYE